MIKIERLDDTYVELYERLGGEPVITRAVTGFQTAMLADPDLKPFFQGVDTAKLLARQLAFFTMIFGGPNAYDGLDMRRAHAPARAKGLTDQHLEAAIGHFRTALAAQGIEPALVIEAQSYLQSMRDDMIGR